jgi:tryptophan halogenase
MRDDSDFWNHVRTMNVPDSLQEKMELWRRSARVAKYSQGLFFEPSWIAVYLGQGIVPEGWDQRADTAALPELERAVERLRRQLAKRVAAMPDHADFIARRNASIGGRA